MDSLENNRSYSCAFSIDKAAWQTAGRYLWKANDLVGLPAGYQSEGL